MLVYFLVFEDSDPTSNLKYFAFFLMFSFILFTVIDYREVKRGVVF